MRIEGGASWTLGIDADAFFRDYQSVFGGKASGFEVPIGFWGSINSYQFDEASIGVSGGYYRAVMRENYNYAPITSDTSFGPSQNISQNMTLTCIPVMIGLDFFPFKRQFTGYLGAAAGVGFTSFVWTEEISASQSVGARTGGTRYNDQSIAPALSARFGVSLGLDDAISKEIRAAIMFEAAYLYMPLSAPLMAEAAKSFSTRVPPRLQGDYNVQTGGLQIKLGIAITIAPVKRNE